MSSSCMILHSKTLPNRLLARRDRTIAATLGWSRRRATGEDEPRTLGRFWFFGSQEVLPFNPPRSCADVHYNRKRHQPHPVALAVICHHLSTVDARCPPARPPAAPAPSCPAKGYSLRWPPPPRSPIAPKFQSKIPAGQINHMYTKMWSVHISAANLNARD